MYLCTCCSTYTQLHQRCKERTRNCVKKGQHQECQTPSERSKKSYPSPPILFVAFVFWSCPQLHCISSDYIVFFAVDLEAFRLKILPRSHTQQGRDIFRDWGVSMTWQVCIVACRRNICQGRPWGLWSPGHHLCLAMDKAAGGTGLWLWLECGSLQPLSAHQNYWVVPFLYTQRPLSVHSFCIASVVHLWVASQNRKANWNDVSRHWLKLNLFCNMGKWDCKRQWGDHHCKIRIYRK